MSKLLPVCQGLQVPQLQADGLVLGEEEEVPGAPSAGSCRQQRHRVTSAEVHSGKINVSDVQSVQRSQLSWSNRCVSLFF